MLFACTHGWAHIHMDMDVDMDTDMDAGVVACIGNARKMCVVHVMMLCFAAV